MSKCWYCNNELTSGDSPKHFGICNKCYDKMFKSGDTIIRSFTNKISDLEAKLAESEKQRQHLKDWLDNEILTSVDNESYYATINEYEEEVKELKQQLEEKDADIIALDTDNYSFKQQIDNLRQQLKSQPKEIVEKIRNICCVEDKCEDGSFILGINEKDLDTILKEYQK